MHLEQLGYLNDEQFAIQWAAARVRSRGFGRRRIELELRQKGIGQDTIRTAFASVLTPDEEKRSAERAAGKKLKTLLSVALDVRKQRLAGFLERRGFTAEIIRSILRGL